MKHGFNFEVYGGFDFSKTYGEYGFGTEDDVKDAVSDYIGAAATDVLCLHNCIIVRTTHLGTSSDILASIKDNFGALSVVAAVFSPYIEKTHGLFYNIYMAENLSRIKHPI